MRRTLLLFALIIMATSMMAQLTLTTKSKKAKELFTEAKYSNSFTQREQYLLDAIKKDKYFIEAYWVLADDYNKREKGEQAAELLIIADGEKFERRQETLLYLAETYYLMGKYDLAVQTLEKVTDLNLTRQKNALSKKFMNALYLFENPTEFNPVCLDAVNTEFDNYFPSITADGSMISTTVQVEENTQHGKFSHEDIYQSINFKGEWQKAVPLDAPMNTPRTEGSQSFSADGRYMFFEIGRAHV